MFRGIRTFTRRVGLVVATVPFILAVGLALYLYLGGEWSTVAAAIDRGRAYVPDLRVEDVAGLDDVRERLAEWIAPNRSTPESFEIPAETGDSGDAPASSETIQLFFTPVPESRKDGPDDRLVRLIRSAKKSVHGAFYDLDYAPVADALIDRHAAGVEVRLVSDSEYRKRLAMRACIAEGIPVEFDGRKSYMHNKFCVVDGEWVWTGSTNITRNGFFFNNNNAILLRSTNAAERFATEFHEMFAARSFGARSPRNTSRKAFQLGQTTLEIYFAPEDGVERQIRAEIGEADESIAFMAFAFTSKPIAEAMVDRMKWGVNVRGLLETRGSDTTYSRDDFLKARGATVYFDDNPKSMHHKVIIVDRRTVITGSYNFSNSAEKRNDENVLIVHSPEIAEAFTAEFERLTASL